MRRTGPSVLIIAIDPVACDGYGYCAELLPEHVTLDEWGYPIVDGQPLGTDQVALATRAAAECPRRAFMLKQREAFRRWH
jgi:ferredoxin